MRQFIAALLLCVAVTAQAVRPKYVIVADFQRPDQRFDLSIPVGDTRDIEVWCAQNNNEWVPGSGWVAYLKYMPSFDATGAYTMVGTVSSNIVTFTPAQNYWGFPVRDWTVQVELQNASDTSRVETAEGSLQITKSSANITNAFVLVPITSIWSNETYNTVSIMLTSKVNRIDWMASNVVYDAWIALFESWKNTNVFSEASWIASSNSVFQRLGSNESAVAALDSWRLTNTTPSSSDLLKLDSNTWAAADSTTNFVRRTGDVMTGNLTANWTGTFHRVNASGGMLVSANGSSSSTGITFAANSGGTHSLWAINGYFWRNGSMMFDQANLSTGDIWTAIGLRATDAQRVLDSNTLAAAIGLRATDAQRALDSNTLAGMISANAAQDLATSNSQAEAIALANTNLVKASNTLWAAILANSNSLWAALSAETNARIAADALLAPVNGPLFTNGLTVASATANGAQMIPALTSWEKGLFVVSGTNLVAQDGVAAVAMATNTAGVAGKLYEARWRISGNATSTVTISVFSNSFAISYAGTATNALRRFTASNLSNFTVTASTVSGGAENLVVGSFSLREYTSGDEAVARDVTVGRNITAGVGITAPGFNSTNVISATAFASSGAAQAFSNTIYVSMDAPSSVVLFKGWTNNIISAVQMCPSGGIVYIEAGRYNVTNFVTVAKPITIKGAGSSATFLNGGGTNSNYGAFRCSGLGTNTVVSSMTISNFFCGDDEGGAMSYGYIEDCTVSGNGAFLGGGLARCVAKNCIIEGNRYFTEASSGGEGGGAYYCTIYNSILRNNVCDTNTVTAYGGGAAYSIIYDSIIIDNLAYDAGGAGDSTLFRCVVTGNVSTTVGGGVDACSVFDSRVIGNKSPSGSGGYDSTFDHCIIKNDGGSTGTVLRQSSASYSEIQGGALADASAAGYYISNSWWNGTYYFVATRVETQSAFNLGANYFGAIPSTIYATNTGTAGQALLLGGASNAFYWGTMAAGGGVATQIMGKGISASTPTNMQRLAYDATAGVWSNVDAGAVSESDPIWTAASNGYQVAGNYATGTPLYVFTELDTIGKAWGSSGITAAATAQTTGPLAYALAAPAQANQPASSNSLQAQVTAAIGATGITFSAGSGLVLSNVYNPVTRQFNVYLTTNLANPGGTNWVFWFKSTNCPAYGVRFQTDGE